MSRSKAKPKTIFKSNPCLSFAWVWNLPVILMKLNYNYILLVMPHSTDDEISLVFSFGRFGIDNGLYFIGPKLFRPESRSHYAPFRPYSHSPWVVSSLTIILPLNAKFILSRSLLKKH